MNPANPRKRKFFRLHTLSLRERLPLLICVLLLSLIAVFGSVAWIGVRKASMRAGKERLLSLSSQLSNMFTASATSVKGQLNAAAREQTLLDFLQRGDTDTSLTGGAEGSLAKLIKDTTVRRVELLNDRKIPIASVGESSIDIPRNSVIPENDSAGVGHFYVQRDSIWYPAWSTVKMNGQSKGYIVQWRLVKASPQTIEQFAQLIGAKARVYFGNTDGKFWTDLMGTVKAPGSTNVDAQGIKQYEREGRNAVIAKERTVPGTQWVLLLEFPVSEILSASNQFLYWLIISGLAILIIGIVITRIMSSNITRPLNRLTAAVSAASPENYSFRLREDRTDEIGVLTHAFNEMLGQVKNAHDVLQRKMSEAEQMSEELRELSAHLQDIREEERKHIAREIHDELGQLLTAFKMDISILKKRLGNENLPLVAEQVTDMTNGVDEAIKFVRRLASELRPAILDDLGLVAALEWYTEEFNHRYSIEVDFRVDRQEYMLPAPVVNNLFRIYQESLTNVARHAKATKVVAELRLIEGFICLSLKDNGVGFSGGKNGKKTLGLTGMKERALMIGGRLDIESLPGEGVGVNVSIPLPGDPQQILSEFHVGLNSKS